MAKVLKAKGLVFHKEMKFHPTFMGEQLESYIKMDLVVESPAGNIIVECKALTQLTEKEHYQTFGYLRATKFPIAILVNFGTDRRAQIERFHYSEGKLYIFYPPFFYATFVDRKPRQYGLALGQLVLHGRLPCSKPKVNWLLQA